MRILSWIVSLPFAAVLGVFAVSNRANVRLDLWPLPFGLEVPIYLIALGPLAVGFLLGLATTWVASGRLRVRIRARNREVRMLEQRTEALKHQLELAADTHTLTHAS
ncbi:hypothetical protein RIEGSTA812A_PEG_150 [invertebrate metagenome]|uniref:Lipopolysaccharide assembly protein A domain-containing protein n=1 Tax=invertebrate metagenome TaxID=1711999 RepID=A0A484H4N7_9ZZZZ